MSKIFPVVAEGQPNIFSDVVSEGDVIRYEFDFTAWQEDNSTITSASWVVESGDVAVSGQALSSGVLSALITAANAGRALVSVLASTANEKKKVWLDLRIADPNCFIVDDYGFSYG